MKRKIPGAFVIISILLLLSAVATWLIPAGEWAESEAGLPVWQGVESRPQTWQVFSALMNGFVRQAPIIVFILITGAAFSLVGATGAMESGIRSFVRRSSALDGKPFFKRIGGVGSLVIVAVMLLFSLFGAVFGMSEETVAFVPLLVPLAISLGYDSFTGLCMVYLAAHVGFSGAFLNPFTIGIAQQMSALPLFSAMGYRLLCWVVLTAVAIVFVLIYAVRIRRKPSLSPVYEEDAFWREKLNAQGGQAEAAGVEAQAGPSAAALAVFLLSSAAILTFTILYSADCALSFGDRSFAAPALLPAIAAAYLLCGILTLRKGKSGFILCLLGFTIVYLIVGVLAFGWYLPEISALFLAMGIAIGTASGMDSEKLVAEMLAGAKDMLSSALVIGLATGIIVILEEGRVMATILHALENGLGSGSPLAALGGMYGVQTLINLVIPSASAKAAITMPLMAPLCDLIGLSRQACVLAFQFGDGFTNMITPTSGVLIAALGMARIPYAVWVKHIWKFILGLVVLGFALLALTLVLSPSGF